MVQKVINTGQYGEPHSLGEKGDVYINSPLDPFNRVRISNPTTIFDSKLLKSTKDPRAWAEAQLSGSGASSSSPTQAKPYVDITTTASAATHFVRQSKRRMNYQPGKGQLIFITGVLQLNDPGTGVIRRIGYFDENNGIFFEDNEGTINLVVRTNDSGSPVDTVYPQSQWNIDRFDGNKATYNPSGLEIDWTKSQIFVMDFQWLGVGTVRFGLDLNDRVHYCHKIQAVNELQIPWCSNPNLPIRYEVIGTDSSPQAQMRCICSTVVSEGGYDPIGAPFAASTGGTIDTSVSGNYYAMIGLQLRPDTLGTQLDVRNISVLSDTTDNIEWLLTINASVASTFDYQPIASSSSMLAAYSSANGTTVEVSGADIIARGYVPANTDLVFNLHRADINFGANVSGESDSLILVVRSLGAGAKSAAALSWVEYG